MGNLQQYAELMSSQFKAITFGSRFSLRKKSTTKMSSTAIEFNEHGFAVVEVMVDKNQLKIVNCSFVHNTNTKIRGELINELFDRKRINKDNCKIVLSGHSYKFLLAEAPNAPLESLRHIMPNKIKDSLPWKLSEVTADVLQLPQDAFKGRKNSVYVAVAQTELIDNYVRLLMGVGIQPDNVTTVELGLRAYWPLINPEPKKSIGIMRITESGGVIVMMCDGDIYLARRIVIDLNSLNEEGVNRQDVFDQVVLEIQRSVEFYESQLGKGSVSKVVMLPPPLDLGVGFDYIEQNISTDIEIFRPFETLGFDQDMTAKDQSYCVGALGAAMEGLKYG